MIPSDHIHICTQGKFVASFLKLSLQSKAATKEISLMHITTTSTVCGVSTALQVTHIAGSSQAVPTRTHRHTRTHDNQAARLLEEEFTLQTHYLKYSQGSPFLGPCGICFLHGHSLSVCSYTQKLNNGFPVTHWRNTFLLGCREITVTQNTSHDSTSHKSRCERG